MNPDKKIQQKRQLKDLGRSILGDFLIFVGNPLSCFVRKNIFCTIITCIIILVTIYILWIFRNYLPKFTVCIRIFIIIFIFFLLNSAHKIIKKENNQIIYSILVLSIIGYITVLCYTKLFGIL